MKNMLIIVILISIILIPILKILILKLFSVMDELLDYDYYNNLRQKYSDPFRDELREERKYASENYKGVMKEMLHHGEYKQYLELHKAVYTCNYIRVYNIIMDYMGEDDNISVIDGEIIRKTLTEKL